MNLLQLVILLAVVCPIAWILSRRFGFWLADRTIERVSNASTLSVISTGAKVLLILILLAVLYFLLR